MGCGNGELQQDCRNRIDGLEGCNVACNNDGDGLLVGLQRWTAGPVTSWNRVGWYWVLGGGLRIIQL